MHWKLQPWILLEHRYVTVNPTDQGRSTKSSKTYLEILLQYIILLFLENKTKHALLGFLQRNEFSNAE